jgi:hypothetical protein
MRIRPKLVLGALCSTLAFQPASGSERYFTYTYEPETMPQSALEFEQWLTLRAGRNQAVGQENFNRWELREELEYGVTDNYTVSLYLQGSLENFHDPLAARDRSRLRFDGVSLENRYLVLNPADHAVGLALYLEPRLAGDEAELEERIILGQRYADWKWALNLTHATGWLKAFHATEGELEVSLGITRHLTRRWSVGVEARDHNELPDYAKWQNTAFYVGPVVTYEREKWWATLTVMPQVFGANFDGDPDKNANLELEGHERWNARVIFGISF